MYQGLGTRPTVKVAIWTHVKVTKIVIMDFRGIRIDTKITLHTNYIYRARVEKSSTHECS